MQLSARRRTRGGCGAVLLTLLTLLGTGTQPASAAGPPIVVESWSSAVFSSSARLQAKVNPNGLSTSYHFDYITKAAYDANGGNFTGASRIPPVSDSNIGSGTNPVSVLQLLSTLQPDTIYRYRVVAKNSGGTTFGSDLFFATFSQAVAGSDPCANAAFRRDQDVNGVLPDCRAFEMVSPVDKNGGRVDLPGTLAGGGVLQAASGGGAITYSSASSFGEGSQGATSASQYVGSRTEGGWSTQNITAPLFSGSYDTETGGAPYRLFSGDLGRGLLLSGKHCRGAATGCPVANPPLPGTDAPPGYQNYYLRESAGPSFEALLGAGDVAELNTDPADFSLSLSGVSPDLKHVVLSSCSPLTAGATDGCPGDENLYKWSGGALSLVNSAPGAALAAQSGAVSSDGSRVYWTDTTTGHLYVRSGATTALVSEAATFQTVSTDGAFAFYTKADEHLYRYSVAGAASTDLTPGGGVEGVLGASSNGDTVYYLDGSGLKRWKSGTTTPVAADADASNYPPATGTSRVSADGTRLLFLSSAYSLNGYDNTDLKSPALCGQPTGICDSEVYLYDGQLTCVSCNPSNGRPAGASSIPGATENGTGPEATIAYKPRALSADGKRVFFDSRDALVLSDTNNVADVYQWEAQGSGSCTRAGGCIALISSGRAAGGATFVDSSADGDDAYFLTEGSLVATDPGSTDLYDARSGGGFPLSVKPIPCGGDSCQVLPPEPVDPTLTTLLSGKGNPPVRYQGGSKRCKKKSFVKRKGKCVPRRKRHQKRSGR